MILSLVCCSFGVLGCGGTGDSGPPRAAVSGNVSWSGEPVLEGTIDFIPTSPTGGPSASAKIVKGAYSLSQSEGAVVGPNRVEIRAVRKTGKTVDAGPPSPPGTKVEVIESYIPAKYNAKSGLSAELKAGANKAVDFKLTP